MMGTIARAKTIAARHPWWARPFVRFALGRCGDCPSRIICIDDMLGGPGSLRIAVDSFDCRHGRDPSKVSEQISRFARERCFKCAARPACAQYLGNHIMMIGAGDRDGWPQAKARIDDIADICIPCDGFPGCVEGALGGPCGMLRTIVRYFWIRVSCLIGRRGP